MNVLSEGSGGIETEDWPGYQRSKQENATSKAETQSWLFGGISPQIHISIVVSKGRAMQRRRVLRI
jgi:hypothetical protein